MKSLKVIFTLICFGQIACSQEFKSATGSSESSTASLNTPPTDGETPTPTPNPVPSPTPNPTPSPTPTPGPMGPAGCGLANAAFCDNFNQGPAAIRGRGGDLDATKWSASRLAPSDLNGGGHVANPVRAAVLPACRSSFGSTPVYPPFDTLICDPEANGNRRLMTMASIQYYGVNSYMIQQPFDFAGRTGKIVFDVDAVMTSGLGGFAAIEITEDPVQAPTFQHFQNYEVGPIPKNAIMLKFTDTCNTSGGTNIRLGEAVVYNDYVMNIITTPAFNIPSNNCLQTRKGSLNHFEIQLSQNKIEVYGSDYSTDGVTIRNQRLIYTANISLNFSRAYVRIATRNHASLKYGDGPIAYYYWDNVGFDGPVISGNKFYGVADNTKISTYQTYGNETIMNLGYMLRDGSNGPAAGMYDPINKIGPLQIANVDKTGSTKARLTLSAAFSPIGPATTAWGIKFRFNGGTWHTRTLTAREVLVINNEINPNGGSAMNISLMMDVPMADLANGTNSLEFESVGAPMNFPPVVANIDLMLSN